MTMTPTKIILHKITRTLELEYENGEKFILPCEYLRVFSPSAEVRGHGGGEIQWVFGKEHVNILTIEPVGHYAIKPVFSDGHRSGIYSWDTLYDLGVHHAENWQKYLALKGKQ